MMGRAEWNTRPIEEALQKELTDLRQNLKEAIADITMIAEYNSGTGIHQFEPINKITLERIIGIFRLHNLIQEE